MHVAFKKNHHIKADPLATQPVLITTKSPSTSRILVIGVFRMGTKVLVTNTILRDILTIHILRAIR